MESAGLGKRMQVVRDTFAARSTCTIGALSEGAAALAIGVTLFAMVFLAEGMTYSNKATFLVPNGVLLIVACVFIVLFLAACASRPGRRLAAFSIRHPRAFDIAVGLLCIVMFVLQVRACRYYAFTTGWDSGAITGEALNLANGGGLSLIWYFSRYPNNLLLLWVAEQCGRVAIALGLASLDGVVFVFSILNCASCMLASWCMYRALSIAASRMWGLVGFGLCVLVIWTSPWAGILYSDAIMACVPAVLLRLFVAAQQHGRGARRTMCFVFMGFVGVLGYSIKPQMIFMLFAIGFLLLACVGATAVHAVRERRGSSLVKPVASLASLIAGCAAASLLVAAIVSPWSVQLDKNAQFGATHFLMMGLNPETRGMFLESDVGYSASFGDQASRTAGNVQVILQRVSEYGPSGLIGLFGDKLMTNFNDGTFAWGGEGHFFDWLPPENGDGLTSLVRSFYYPGGARCKGWRTYAQFMWVGVLASCFVGLASQGVSCFRGRKSGAVDSLTVPAIAVSLAMLMLIAFELLFEARARYLYSSVTLFIFFAVLGLRQMLVWTRSLHERHS